jgi:hypothetical protein
MSHMACGTNSLAERNFITEPDSRAQLGRRDGLNTEQLTVEVEIMARIFYRALVVIIEGEVFWPIFEDVFLGIWYRVQLSRSKKSEYHT